MIDMIKTMLKYWWRQTSGKIFDNNEKHSNKKNKKKMNKPYKVCEVIIP